MPGCNTIVSWETDKNGKIVAHTCACGKRTQF